MNQTLLAQWDATPLECKVSWDPIAEVAITALIRCNATGEIRQHETKGYVGEDESGPSTFIWEEGNYSCDCNRHIFFHVAGGGDYEDDEADIECSDGKYSVNLVNPKTGEVFYREFDGE
jgi:hypothetical protein